MSGRKLTDADKAIWQRVAKTVNSYKPLPKSADRLGNTGQVDAQAALSGKAPRSASLIRRRAPQTSYAFPELPLAAERRVRRGKVSVERKIDLHDMRQDEAFEALIDCLTRAYSRGQRCVLVVTGKGRMNERITISGTRGGGVLRRMLPLWLESPQLRPMIARIAPAHIKHGGMGAFYVFLKARN